MDAPQDKPKSPQGGLIQRLRDQSISLAVAFIALVFAVGGGAFAGAAVTTKLITSKDIKNGTIRGVDIARGAVRAKHLARGQVRAAALARSAVQARNIGKGQVTAEAIAPDQVGNAQIAPNAIGQTEVAPSAIGPAEIATGAVRSSNIADGSVTSNDIGEGEVTPRNMSLPEPVTLSIPAGEERAVRIAGGDYVLVATVGTYEKEVGDSALQIAWTGTAGSGSGPCIFQLRVDGKAGGDGPGEVFVRPGGQIISETTLFKDLLIGPHSVEIWARRPNPTDEPLYACTVGPAETQIAQTVVVAEQIS